MSCGSVFSPSPPSRSASSPGRHSPSPLLSVLCFHPPGVRIALPCACLPPTSTLDLLHVSRLGSCMEGLPPVITAPRDLAGRPSVHSARTLPPWACPPQSVLPHGPRPSASSVTPLREFVNGRHQRNRLILFDPHIYSPALQFQKPFPRCIWLTGDADLYFTIENCNSERPGDLPGPLGEGFHYEAGPPLSSLWGFPSQPSGHQEARLPLTHPCRLPPISRLPRSCRGCAGRPRRWCGRGARSPARQCPRWPGSAGRRGG